MSYRDIEFDCDQNCTILNDEIRDIINIVWKIDFSHEVDLLKIENSNLSDRAKQARKLSIILAHQETRQPYVELLHDRWEKQCRRSLAA